MSLLKTLNKYVFLVGIFLLLVLAIALRVYNISERSGMGSDSTRDALIAQEALERGEIPLIGSFSSAGPFVFGPLYFWFNMLALFLLPFSFRTPWVLMNIAGTLTVLVMFLTGYFIGGKKLAIITGFFTAFAPQLVSRSTGLSQHSLVAITSALLVLFFVLLWKKGSVKYAFLMGISMGTALSMHYQALNFFIFLPFLFFIPKMKLKKKFLSSVLFMTGVLIPSIPLLYWDSMQEFANIRNVLDYMLIGQYRIYVPNSWKLFIFRFLIDYWSNVVGGNKMMSGILMIITPLTVMYGFIKHKLPGVILSISIIFGVLLFVLRYYRGERFDGYMIYVAPMILILCAWCFSFLFDLVNEIKNPIKKRVFSSGILLFILLILAFDLKNASQFLFTKNPLEKEISEAIYILSERYPNKNFQVYDYRWLSSDISYALGGYLKQEEKTENSGVKIGVVFNTLPFSSEEKPLYKGSYWEIISLEKFSDSQIQKPEWTKANPNDIYDDLMKWQKNEKLTSTFHLDKYILERMHLD